MSRAFDAKQSALAAYPENRENAVGLFLTIMDCSHGDFEYENNQTPEEYIFGNVKEK